MREDDMNNKWREEEEKKRKNKKKRKKKICDHIITYPIKCNSNDGKYYGAITKHKHNFEFSEPNCVVV